MDDESSKYKLLSDSSGFFNELSKVSFILFDLSFFISLSNLIILLLLNTSSSLKSSDSYIDTEERDESESKRLSIFPLPFC